MNNQEIEALLKQALELEEVYVQSDGSHFNIIAVGAVFDGQRPVKRQQLVFGPLTDQIADGTLHAITIKAYTPAEWARDKKLVMPG
ncbi:BolA family protein [Gallaecimonas sp. GXIMD4217]|uniref:BolA family protein n=1 Tax=Gallaecimonas sp. GXIMD4217 TaxID=3131927 RepID=UPI00311B06DB